MTFIASVSSNIALQILQQPTSVLGLDRSDSKSSAIDTIAAIVRGISSEPDPVETKASDVINSSLLSLKENQDIVSDTLKILSSNQFKTSDPGVTETLKKLVEKEGSAFALLVKTEKATKPGITHDNAIANAVRSFILNNRSDFGDDEFVIGFKLNNGGAIMWNIEDINGESTSKTLSKRTAANREYWDSLNAAFLEKVRDPTKILNYTDEDYEKASDAFFSSIKDEMKWFEMWATPFGFIPPNSF